jgi:hypothetical protein
MPQRALLNDRQPTHEASDMRHDPRFMTNDPAVLQILNPYSEEDWNVDIVDVSKNGLRLYLATGVMPGSLLKVRMKHHVAFGEARYCMPATGRFFVGVQIHDYVSRCADPEDIAKRKETA